MGLTDIAFWVFFFGLGVATTLKIMGVIWLDCDICCRPSLATHFVIFEDGEIWGGFCSYHFGQVKIEVEKEI